MITFPKMIEATGNDCMVASVQMACMYWRHQRPNLQWKDAPIDLEDAYWSNFYKKGSTYLRPPGMPMNNVKRFLKSLNMPLNADYELMEDTKGLRKLIDLNIPPIVIYDNGFYFKQIRGLGHAVLLVDCTNETLISVDPAFSPKFFTPLYEKHFIEAWKEKKNSVVTIYPDSYKFLKTEVPSTNLLPFITLKEREN